MKKWSSTPGQDLRLPVMGGTKFPTHDSTGAASKKLQQSSAEVGPQPATTYSTMGKMKKSAIGDAMDPMTDDPLVLYLKKVAAKDTAKEPPPLTDLLDGSKMKDNLDAMPLGTPETELQSQPPEPTKRMIPETPSPCVKDHFENAQAMRKKLYEKDHHWEGFDQGVVDRILGL